MPYSQSVTTKELTEARISYAKGLFKQAMKKASSEDPPYSDDIAIRREIQSSKDIIKIEESTLALINSGAPVPSTVWPGPILQSEFIMAPMADLTTGF